MHNGEIRNRVLVRLYRKYYGIRLSSAIDAEQVVRYAAILSENSDLAYRNVNYLAQSSLIKEEKPLEEKNPKCISITHYGIDTIERKVEEFAKLHDDIRLNFLSSYMNTILGDHKESTILIDINFIKFVRSNEPDQNFVIGDINYLDRKGLIKGLRQFGALLLCSEYFEENDAVERVINQSLLTLRNQIQMKKLERSSYLISQKKRTKLQKFRDFIGDNVGWIELVANVARASLTGGQSA